MITVPGQQGGADGERVKERGGRKRKEVIQTHHSTSCCRGVAERFIDHLRMRPVREDEEVLRHEGENEGGQYE